MQDDDFFSDDLSDDIIDDESDTSEVEDNKLNAGKLDSRRKLEDYLEKKRLRDDFDYF